MKAHDKNNKESSVCIYDNGYVEKYLEDYYLHPFWSIKIKENRNLLSRVMKNLPTSAIWLDLFCGAAQYFEVAGNDIFCIGIDYSLAQLKRAKSIYSSCSYDFFCCDVRNLALSENSRFNLITSFWAALSYLRSPMEWYGVLQAVSQHMASNALLYLENPFPPALMDFNETTFSKSLTYRVLKVDKDEIEGWTRWIYTDSGGLHKMLTPDFVILKSLLEDIGLITYRISTVQTIEQIVAVRPEDEYLVKQLIR